jgi:polyprenyl-phospho-N-acetylgalactosaminyl synthase
METSDVVVIVPAYNEALAIREVLAQLVRLPYRIVVVDDGSSDDTFRVCRQFPVTVLHHACNLGQGAALQTGITYVLLSGNTRFIVTFDSDGQHCTDDIPRLLAPLEAGTHDIVLGSRFLRTEDAPGIGSWKRVLLRVAIAFTRLTTGLKLTDTHNGMRAFTVDAARRIPITQNRMAHASEILSAIAKSGLRWHEVPVTIRYTDYSKRKGQTLLESVNIMWDFTAARLR